MSVVWTITPPGGGGPVPLADIGIEVARGSFRVDSASRMILRAARDFDAEGSWYAGDSIVTIRRDGVPFFTGRASPGVDISAFSEGAELELIDPYLDLTEITYEEAWPIGSGNYMLPYAVLGMDSTGDPITTGEQISEAISFAISKGAYLSMGSIAEGVSLWPTEATNVTCEWVVRESMGVHPDWSVVVSHGTVPPSVSVRSRDSFPQHTIAISDGELAGLNFRPRHDLVPRGVRVIYETATTVDDEVYRDIALIDAVGASGGRKVITAVIKLSGSQSQIQKQRIQTRPIPDDGDNEDLKEYLMKKYPQLANIDEDAWEVSNYTKELVVDEEALPDPISPQATRLSVANVNQLPRELVRGSIEDWMRRRVGEVLLKFDVKIVGGTAEERKALKGFRGHQEIVVTGTNAVTKLYRGVTQWTPAESAPTIGLAAAVMGAASLHYEGSLVRVKEEIPGYQLTGQRLTVTHNGVPLFTSALIHSHDFDIDTGEETISFGPPPDVPAQDAYEIQQRIRQRPVKWWSKEERQSNRLGGEFKPSAKGDTVGHFDLPRSLSPPGGGESDPVLGELVPTTEIPPDLEGSGDAPDSGDARVYVTTGLWNGVIASNSGESFDIDEGSDQYFFAKASMNVTSDRFSFSSWEIVHGSSITSHATSAWPTNGDLPTTVVVYLGKYSGTTKKCAASKGGSIWSSLSVAGIKQTDGVVTFTREINHSR